MHIIVIYKLFLLNFKLHRRILDRTMAVDEPLNETGYDGRGLIVRGLCHKQNRPETAKAKITCCNTLITA